ncbi:MAG: hypothetical protein JWO13_1579 [Acidobacteriales bacterium]|nr:hypothetical protein [Terriglobales bacterium]
MPVKPLSPVDCIGPAVERTEKLMFQPARWSRWWRIALLGLATGEFASSGGCNSGFRDFGKLSNPSGGAPGGGPHIPEINAALIASVVAILVVAAIVLALVHLYVASVSRFMLFDSVAADRYRLRESWSRWHSHGLRYFLFNLAFGAIVLCLYAVLFGAPLLAAWRAGLFTHPREHAAALLFAFLGMIPILLAILLPLAIAHLFIKDFAIPIIALENITIPNALRKLWGMVKAAKGDFAIYVLLKIVIAIAAAIALAIIDIILLLILLIPIGIVAGIIIAAVGTAAFHNPVTIAIAVTAAVIVVLPLVLFVIGFVAAPAVVFYVSYSLYFLGSRYEVLWNYMHPVAETPVPVVPTIPPAPENPPLDMPPDPSPA